MNRTIKEATVQRYHYDSHDQLRIHLSDFVAAYNFAKRFKTLGGLTAYAFICKCWQKEPDDLLSIPSMKCRAQHLVDHSFAFVNLFQSGEKLIGITQGTPYRFAARKSQKWAKFDREKYADCDAK
jgi:hypothetical protein